MMTNDSSEALRVLLNFVLCFFLDFYLFLRNGPFKCELKEGGERQTRTHKGDDIPLYIIISFDAINNLT
jgi:hypothetical protein